MSADATVLEIRIAELERVVAEYDTHRRRWREIASRMIGLLRQRGYSAEVDEVFADYAEMPACERCGKPAAYLGARFCGAACTAQHEAER